MAEEPSPATPAVPNAHGKPGSEWGTAAADRHQRPAGRIDAHHHLWDLNRRDQPWISAEMAAIRRDFHLADLAPLADQANITGTVLVQTRPDTEETTEFLALAQDTPLVAGVVGWADLRAPDIAERLARLRALPGSHHLVGVRHQAQDEPDPRWLTRGQVLFGLRAVAEQHLAYDLLTLPHQLPAAIEAAAALPQLTLVLDHLSKPAIARGELHPWAERVRALARHPQVYCKLSGMVTEADWDHWTIEGLRPYAETILDAFGPERVMFGSDWPVCLLAASYAQVMDAAEQLTRGLTSDERHAVFSDTAVRAYALTLPT